MLFYLAGPFTSYKNEKGLEYNDWRDYVIENVPKHSFLDPRNNKQDSPMFFTPQDLKSVTKSDGIVLYRPVKGEIIGGSWEHGIACGYNEASKKKKIHTIYVDEKKFIFPLLSASAKRTFTDLESAVTYLNFLDSWKNEFKAIMSYLDWEDNFYKKLKDKKRK